MQDQKYTAAFYTLGCKVAQYETEAIREAFADQGFLCVPFEARADVYVINTCTVTQESDAKSRKAIRRACRNNPAAVVMVTGCYSQVSPDEVMAIPGVSYVGGSGRKTALVPAALRLLSEREEGKAPKSPVLAVTDIHTEKFEPMTVRESPRTRAYVKIEDGCECRCTYCAIPGARGAVRSKPPADILKEVTALALAGTREVVLTGIETASYGADFEKPFGLTDLLRLLEEACPIERLRLGSLTPEILRPPFVEELAQLRKLQPHFHLSVQSGSSKVLASMRRRYNREMALSGILALQKAIPGVCLSADIIVGFPGESEADFEDTLSFAKNAGFLHIHAFPYSRRRGTPAAEMPGQVPDSVKKARLLRLLRLGEELRQEKLARVAESGKPLSVLFETYDGRHAVGHSGEFMEVALPSPRDLHGEVVSVLPLSFTDGIIIAKKQE